MSDQKCVLSQCCCGCTLRTGAWVTAIFCLIGSIVNAANAIKAATRDHNQSSWGTAIIWIVMLVIAILLIHGIRTMRPRLIYIWVYAQIVVTILAIIMLIISVSLKLDILGLIFGFFMFAFIIYFILVVRSYAIELESGGAVTNTV